MSLLEVIAFVVSILGMWLTTTRSLWNYPFSLISVALYGALFYKTKLYADMSLQGIFACALLYGLWQWRRGRSATGDVLITRLRAYEVLISLLAGAIAAGTLGILLDEHTDASLPWVVVGTTIASLTHLAGASWARHRHTSITQPRRSSPHWLLPTFKSP